ncbi:iron chelate uptake ABC transporter family permease subunit [Corynebacterium epidermidicanis]|uniref:ABC-type Fe3+-siderophore transport system, permease component n=1 Tax=Corynebacterium epidermidicanis TaxID=1050174 RepID=A0A0G3GLF2_9CORY|nr:iron chelate uptake ABC transporter family permease subunit [Corynebacterium epidermidicanis]AKK01989.1 ABC-type Fe3+-siderophore transport system, permease component [Corynebacterium epidermidicanis]
MPIHIRRAPLAVVLALALGALGLSTVLSLTIGARAIALPEIWQALHTPSGDTVSSIVWDRRIPRTLVAIICGTSLGLAGALVQALTRNPLADTGVLGINSGAAFAIVLGLALGAPDSSLALLGLALAGATVAGLGIYTLSRGRSAGVDPVRLVLAGVALSAILGGVGDGLALVNPQAFDRLHAWMVGNLDVASYQPVFLCLAGLLLGGLPAIAAIRGLGALQLGEETATALGAQLTRTRVMALASIIILAATATAAAGVIVFLGLLIPHISRWLVGASFGRILTLSALLGPVVLLCADVAGRVLTPGEFPAGVVVSFIGAPFLIAYAQQRGKGI